MSNSSSEQKPSVVITGSGTGIGRATAKRFLKEGWRVVAVGRRLEPLLDLAKQSGDDVLPVSVDLRNPASIALLIERLGKEPRFGQSLSALINNAGTYERREFANSDDGHWASMFETNLFGAVRITRELLPLLAPNRGAITNIASTLALKPVAMTGAYAAAKAALVNWTQALALEVAPSGIRCNCVCPGIVDTPIHGATGIASEHKEAMDKLQPLGRVGKPEEVAHAIWSLCAPGSEWITGAVLAVDGGINLA